MTLSLEDLKLVTKRFALVGGGFFVLGGVGLFVGFKFLESKIATTGHGGDTPVVLVGGSMTFKADAYQTPQAWLTYTANKEYYVSPNYQISTIVLKAVVGPDNDTTGSGDANSSTDKIRVDVSNADTWEIDEYTVASGNTPVVKIAPKQNGSITEIHLYLLDAGGMLCPVNQNNVRIRYSPTTSCPAPPPSAGTTPPVAPIFSQVSIRLNNDLASDGVTPQPTATLNCIDSTGDPTGKCKIVLKGTPP
jgi:hypothetical protein